MQGSKMMSENRFSGMNIHSLMGLLPAVERAHMHRVSIYVEKLVGILRRPDIGPVEIEGEQYQYYGQAASFHDIGKVCVPVSLLSKPGKLTKTETFIMSKHPEFAQEIFELIREGAISGFPRHLIELSFLSALYHHEWWNGKGYPHAISKYHIPLVARITSVCDAYDSITSTRSYRAAHTHPYACRKLQQNAGTQFDPEISPVFLEHEEEFFELYQELTTQR
jgi:HD-GYP domain-containing protein (c-di-GMP phosphodiesterase class II)